MGEAVSEERSDIRSVKTLRQSYGSMELLALSTEDEVEVMIPEAPMGGDSWFNKGDSRR